MQKRKQRKDRYRLFAIDLCLVIALMAFWATDAVCAVKTGKGAKVTSEQTKESLGKEVLAELLKEYFTYERENRSDPFVPFVKKKQAQIGGKGKGKGSTVAQEEVELTGMQLFEPGQLSLVSIVFTNDRALAMVQDSAGKGYIIERGTLIGRTGIVESVTPNVVAIKQWSLSISGKKKYKTIEMVLRKEGE